MDASDTPSAHVCTTITFEIKRDNLAGYTDEYLAQLWHISQANPAPFGDRAACEFAEHVARECVRRFVSGVPLALWNHQGCHVATAKAAIKAPADDLLRDAVAPGSFITLWDAMLRMGLEEGGASQESLAREALIRLGFVSGREQQGLRRRGWFAPRSKGSAA